METGDFIRKIRKEKNMTQLQLAKASGLSINTIRLCEANKVSPSYKTIARIAQSLGFEDIDVFFYVLNRADFEEFKPKEYSQLISEHLQSGGQIDASGRIIIEFKQNESSLLKSFRLLNEEGQQKAVERIEELAEIPRYQRQPAHTPDKTPPEGNDPAQD